MSILSKNLKLLRKESYLSFEEIVEKIGVSEEEFLEWEEGLSEPDEDTLEIACQVLKMPYEDIRERDLTLEREEATKQMKTSGARKNYDWYFGSKSVKVFHIIYILYFVLGLSLTSFVLYNIIKAYGDFSQFVELFPGMSIEEIKFRLISQSIISCFSVFAGGAGVFLIIWYFKRHTFRFYYWYLFILGLLLTLYIIVSAIACIPFFVYSIIQLFSKRKKV